eukprot:gene12441-16686_t
MFGRSLLGSSSAVIDSTVQNNNTNANGTNGNDSRFSLVHLRKLHSQLVEYITSKNSGAIIEYQESIVEILRNLAEMVVYGDNKSEMLFDFFCEKNMLSLFLELMWTTGSPGGCPPCIHIQILQTLSILINCVKNDTSLYYLLSNNYINEIIIFPHEFKFDEALCDQFASFLKSVSLKLNIQTVQFFFIEETGSFPILTRAIELMDLSEQMVKIAAQSTILNIYRVEDFRAREYSLQDDVMNKLFAQFVKTMKSQYHTLVKICHEYNISTDTNNTRLEHSLEDLMISTEDWFYYLQDVLDLNIMKLRKACINFIMIEFIYPVLLKPFSSVTDEDRDSVTTLIITEDILSPLDVSIHGEGSTQTKEYNVKNSTWLATSLMYILQLLRIVGDPLLQRAVFNSIFHPLSRQFRADFLDTQKSNNKSDPKIATEPEISTEDVKVSVATASDAAPVEETFTITPHDDFAMDEKINENIPLEPNPFRLSLHELILAHHNQKHVLLSMYLFQIIADNLRQQSITSHNNSNNLDNEQAENDIQKFVDEINIEEMAPIDVLTLLQSSLILPNSVVVNSSEPLGDSLSLTSHQGNSSLEGINNLLNKAIHNSLKNKSGAVEDINNFNNDTNDNNNKDNRNDFNNINNNNDIVEENIKSEIINDENKSDQINTELISDFISKESEIENDDKNNDNNNTNNNSPISIHSKTNQGYIFNRAISPNKLHRNSRIFAAVNAKQREQQYYHAATNFDPDMMSFCVMYKLDQTYGKELLECQFPLLLETYFCILKGCCDYSLTTIQVTAHIIYSIGEILHFPLSTYTSMVLSMSNADNKTEIIPKEIQIDEKNDARTLGNMTDNITIISQLFDYILSEVRDAIRLVSSMVQKHLEGPYSEVILNIIKEEFKRVESIKWKATMQKMYRDTSIILPNAQFDRLDTGMGIDFDIPISQNEIIRKDIQAFLVIRSLYKRIYSFSVIPQHANGTSTKDEGSLFSSIQDKDFLSLYESNIIPATLSQNGIPFDMKGKRFLDAYIIPNQNLSNENDSINSSTNPSNNSPSLFSSSTSFLSFGYLSNTNNNSRKQSFSSPLSSSAAALNGKGSKGKSFSSKSSPNSTNNNNSMSPIITTSRERILFVQDPQFLILVTPDENKVG